MLDGVVASPQCRMRKWGVCLRVVLMPEGRGRRGERDIWSAELEGTGAS
jgi:hypothetical protein